MQECGTTLKASGPEFWLTLFPLCGYFDGVSWPRVLEHARQIVRQSWHGCSLKIRGLWGVLDVAYALPSPDRRDTRGNGQ